MRRCPYCNNPTANNWLHCGVCGKSLTKISKYGSERYHLICPNCNKNKRDTAYIYGRGKKKGYYIRVYYCTVCGTLLEDASLSLPKKQKSKERRKSPQTCPICGFKNKDPEVIKECKDLGTPTIEIQPGTRVLIHKDTYGTVEKQTKVQRVNRGWHNPSHIRKYLIVFDSGRTKWLAKSALAIVD